MRRDGVFIAGNPRFAPKRIGAGLTRTDIELAWQSDALCAQTAPEEFFPEIGGSTRAAKEICAACDVAAQCLAYALATDIREGIWGGLSVVQRRRIRRGQDA